MILQQLKQAIIDQPGISLAELARKFRLSEDACSAMLQPWVSRQRLTMQSLPGCSGSCGCQIGEQFTLYWQPEQQIGVRLC